MRRQMPALIAAIVSLLAAPQAFGRQAPAPAVPDPAPPAGEAPAAVHRKFINAIGGAEAVEAVKSESYRVTMTAGPVTVRGEMKCAGARSFLLSLDQFGHAVRIGSDGTTGWEHTEEQGYELQPLDELLTQMRVFNLNAAVRNLPREFPAAAAAGQVEFGGEPCHRLKLSEKRGESLYGMFSLATGLFAGLQTETSTPFGMQTVSFRARDWEQTGGIKSFTGLDIRQGEETVGTIAYSDFQHNAVPAGTFDLPADVAALAAKPATPAAPAAPTSPASPPSQPAPPPPPS